MRLRRDVMVLGTALCSAGASNDDKASLSACPGDFHLAGHGSCSLVPTSQQRSSPDGRTGTVSVADAQSIVPSLGSRAYFATSCTAGTYDPELYLRSNLLGKTLRFVVDLQGAGCGCNAMVYLAAMGRSERSECSDHYCDASGACGNSCVEVDIMEANMHAWHSTLHSSRDKSGSSAGYGGGGVGWSGPRDWTSDQYGPQGSCIDTSRPFKVAASFPVDDGGLLAAMHVTLSQEGKSCPLQATVGGYKEVRELTEALSAGMTPVISYWTGRQIDWMDGKGDDGLGPCGASSQKQCGDSVRLSNFSIEEMDNSKQPESAEERPKQQEDFAWLMDSPGVGGQGGWMTSPYSRASGHQVWVSNLENLSEEADSEAPTTSLKGWWKSDFLVHEGGNSEQEAVRHFEVFGGALKEAVGGRPGPWWAAAGACVVGGVACAIAAGLGLSRSLRRSAGPAAGAAEAPATSGRELPGERALRSVASSQRLLASLEADSLP